MLVKILESKKLLADFFGLKTGFFLPVRALEVQNSDKMPKVNVKTEAILENFFVIELSRFNSWDFRL